MKVRVPAPAAHCFCPKSYAQGISTRCLVSASNSHANPVLYPPAFAACSKPAPPTSSLRGSTTSPAANTRGLSISLPHPPLGQLPSPVLCNLPGCLCPLPLPRPAVPLCAACPLCGWTTPDRCLSLSVSQSPLSLHRPALGP